MKQKNRALIIISCALIIGASKVVFLLNKPHRKVEDEKGISVNAGTLVKAYQGNEATANATYLNKTLVVTGILKETGANQSGQMTVLFESEDPMSTVFCTMRDKNEQLTAGKEIKIKGFCSGYTSDVLLTDCVLSKE